MQIEWMTPDQVAAKMMVSSDTVKRLAKAGHLRWRYRAGTGIKRKRIDIDPQSVAVYLTTLSPTQQQ